MKKAFLAIVALYLVSSVFAGSEEKFDNGVLVLTDDTFNQVVAKFDNLLVYFYAEWW